VKSDRTYGRIANLCHEQWVLYHQRITTVRWFFRALTVYLLPRRFTPPR
jgi:hypothetical protein